MLGREGRGGQCSCVKLFTEEVQGGAVHRTHPFVGATMGNPTCSTSLATRL